MLDTRPGSQKKASLVRRGTLYMRKHVLKLQFLLNNHGQDLIEYALVVALIAFAATVGMTTVANGINNAFTAIATKLSTYVS